MPDMRTPPRLPPGLCALSLEPTKDLFGVRSLYRGTSVAGLPTACSASVLVTTSILGMCR
eukprot:scaffold83652_cov48-Phaeocystis_antarctica.AAC.1